MANRKNNRLNLQQPVLHSLQEKLKHQVISMPVRMSHSTRLNTKEGSRSTRISHPLNRLTQYAHTYWQIIAMYACVYIYTYTCDSWLYAYTYTCVVLRLCKGLSKRTKVSRIGLAGATDVFRKHPDDDALGSWGEAVWGLGFGFRVLGLSVASGV